MIVRLVIVEAVAFLGGSSGDQCSFRLLLLLFQGVVAGAAVSNTLLTTPALKHGTAIRSVFDYLIFANTTPSSSALKSTPHILEEWNLPMANCFSAQMTLLLTGIVVGAPGADSNTIRTGVSMLVYMKEQRRPSKGPRAFWAMAAMKARAMSLAGKPEQGFFRSQHLVSFEIGIHEGHERV